jgi:3-deoxy-7-phosphoheptulonate synthase
LVESDGYHTHLSRGVERTIIGAIGDDRGKAQPSRRNTCRRREDRADPEALQAGQPGVPGGKHADPRRRCRRGRSEIRGLAGPCTVESEEQLLESAYIAPKGGADILRRGLQARGRRRTASRAWKKRLKLLKKVRERTGLPVVTEVMSPADVDLVEEYTDILQVVPGTCRISHS